MYTYLRLCDEILETGEQREDRTGTGTLSLFGKTLKFDLSDGFPLLTTKRVFYKGVLHELLWFLTGSTKIHYLRDNGINIWNAWADIQGDVGPIYGYQWRNWAGEYDQIKRLIDEIKTNPTSRRHVVSAWNVSDLPYMGLLPCHYSFQVYIRSGKYLDIIVNQRSADVFLGLPFDIASYATLTHMLAQVTGYEPGRMIYNIGDAHIYRNHIEQVHLQLTREPRQLPKLEIDSSIKNIDSFRYEHFKVVGYDPHPSIKGDVSV